MQGACSSVLIFESKGSGGYIQQRSPCLCDGNGGREATAGDGKGGRPGGRGWVVLVGSDGDRPGAVVGDRGHIEPVWDTGDGPGDISRGDLKDIVAAVVVVKIEMIFVEVQGGSPCLCNSDRSRYPAA